MSNTDNQPKRLGIIVNVQRPEARPTLTMIESWVREHGWEIVATREIDMVADPGFKGFSRDTFPADMDLLLALGGDGTMLTSVRAVVEFGTPVLGVNLGSLGFLTVVPLHRCVESLERIARGEYLIEERVMLEVAEPDSEQARWTALNDIVLMKSGMARLAILTVTCNGEYVTTMAGDGIIIASPTGSTAYSLSAGGPIVMPTMKGFILTPVSPHTLAQRPMVFGAEASLEVKVESLVGEAMLTADGQLAREMGEGSTITIRTHAKSAHLVGFRDRSFLRILREKLHWGIGPSLGREWSDSQR